MYNQKRAVRTLFDSVTAYFSPRIIGEINDVFVKIAKIRGEDIPWHTHDQEDEMFYIIRGSMTMDVKGAAPALLTEGDLFIVRHGTEHRVHSTEECWIMLIENKETKHTGEVQADITKSVEQQRY